MKYLQRIFGDLLLYPTNQPWEALDGRLDFS
jgi:hypothetical protein